MPTLARNRSGPTLKAQNICYENYIHWYYKHYIHLLWKLYTLILLVIFKFNLLKVNCFYLELAKQVTYIWYSCGNNSPVYEIFCFYLFQQYSQPQQTLYSVQQQVCLILTVYITNNFKIMLIVCLVGFVSEIILIWEVVKET